MLYFEDLLTFLKKIADSVNHELKEAPDGKLSAEKAGKKSRLFLDVTEKGQRRRKVITKEADIIVRLARKEYLRILRETVETDIRLLEHIKKRYEDPTPQSVISKMKETYRQLPEEYFFIPISQTYKWDRSCDGDGSCNPADPIAAWACEPYEQSTYKPEKKIHMTSRGIRVRSKSELIIAETLYAEGVPFRYEEILTIGTRRFAPDFTIKRHDGALIYWEHCGMPDNQAYMASHREKLRNYETAGIVPWKNLIVTYDEPDGTINIEIIKSEIQNKIQRR